MVKSVCRLCHSDEDGRLGSANRLDIYRYDKQIQNTLENIQKSISGENYNLIIKYDRLLVSLSQSKASNDGMIPSDIEKKFVDLFGHSYILPIIIPPNGNYDLYVRVFDSENDWVSADTCGIQAIIPIVASGEDSVTIGKIQFSNILVSAIDTNSENLEAAKKIIADAVEKRNNTSVEPKQHSDYDTSKTDGPIELKILPHLEKESFEYGEIFQYTIKTTGDEKYYLGKNLKARFVNKATGTASEWSYVTLEGPNTKVTAKIEGCPFDKKGTYVLFTSYRIVPHYGRWSSEAFEVLSDADKPVTPDNSRILSPWDQINAGFQPSEVICKKGYS